MVYALKIQVRVCVTQGGMCVNGRLSLQKKHFLGIHNRNSFDYCGFRILDREYVTLPTAIHYVNTNQRSSRTNSAIHYVTILPYCS